jgi:predicted permease
MIQDLRYAVRVLVQSKTWTAMVVLSLAFGIGANTALFSAVNGLMLRTLPVEDPGTLVRLRGVGRNQMANSSSDYGSVAREGGLETRTTFSYPMFQQLRTANQTMTDLFAGAPVGSVNVVVDGQAEIASAYIASGNFHAVLGVKPVLGRILTPDDDRAGAPAVTVLSHAFWSRRFGRDPGVLGKVVQANNAPVTIVGVMSPDFTGVQRVISDAPDLTLPLALDPLLNAQSSERPDSPPRLSQPTFWWLQIMGRVKPGATPQQVQGNLEGVFQQAAREGMESFLASLTAEERGFSQNQNRTEVSRLRVSSGARGVYDNSPAELRAVTILSVVVGLILLIVCANVANLMLSRAAARQKELSVRLSLGATRLRLIRQLLTESVLLALVGAGCGVLVAYWGRQLLPGQTGRAPVDWRVLLFAAALAVLTGLLFGIAPALRATGTNVSAALKENSRTLTGSRAFLGKSLLVVQVAVSLLLLIGAGLFLRTVENLRGVDVGFNPRNLVLFRINPQLNRYDPPRIASLYERMMERLQAVPGVRAVTLSNPPLLSGNVNGTYFVVQGRPFSAGPHNDINRVRIAPNFFETMEIPLMTGRAFTPRDDQAAPKVAIINEAAVRRFFPDESPLGRRFGSSPETSAQIEIVGVVRDVKYNSVRDSAPPTMYVPYVQNAVGAMAFEVRTSGDPLQAVGSIREAVRQVDPNVPLMDVSTQIEQIERRFSQERVFAQAYALFGGLALLVASIGLFGLMSYSVTRRTNEIGIRMALGAQRPEVVRMIMGESLILVAIGVAIGLAVALAAGRLIATLLFGVAATDTPTLALAMLVMTAVSAFAGYLPARRASRVDPIVALHYE